MSPKNLIVCADGTGNKGGYSPDSNVYRIYRAIDKSFSGKFKEKGDQEIELSEQIIFYDNGVGTSSNKLLRAIGGAFGFGFARNVCDLYKYIARNYRDGDRIYFFGFSRGASTVRACNGMISKCGLVKGEDLRNSELDERVDEAFNAYKKHKKNPLLAQEFKNNPEKVFANVPIRFLGVWDTVVALGFPKRTDMAGPFSLLFNPVFYLVETIADFFFPHSFYHYALTNDVEYACQALAIDDERTAFWPFVWREKNIDVKPGPDDKKNVDEANHSGNGNNPDRAQDRTPENVEQVWFAGMHSNVGGGL